MEHSRAEHNVKFKELAEASIKACCHAARAPLVNRNDAEREAVVAEITLLQAHLDSGTGCLERIQKRIQDLKLNGRRFDLNKEWLRKNEYLRAQREIQNLKQQQVA